MSDEDFTADDRASELNGSPYAEDAAPAEDLEWPFGFIAVLVLAALYLGWRLIQLLAGVLDFFG